MEADKLQERREFVERITGQRAGATQALLPLDEPRVIAIKDGKFTYTFHFSRIGQGDWERYFDSIHFTSRNQDKARVDTLDLNTCGIELFESTLIRVEGYAGDFMSRDKWQQKIPPRHSYQVAWLLRLVTPSDSESDAPFDPERMEVRLDALWSQTRPGAEVTMFKGLAHWFAPPSAQDKRRFYRSGAETKVVGGSRNGTTVHGSRHRVLLELYDKLILAVDGYGIRGSGMQSTLTMPLLTPEEVRREMDAYHKVEAVTQLFSGGIGPANETTEEAAAA